METCRVVGRVTVGGSAQPAFAALPVLTRPGRAAPLAFLPDGAIHPDNSNRLSFLFMAAPLEGEARGGGAAGPCRADEGWRADAGREDIL